MIAVGGVFAEHFSFLAVKWNFVKSAFVGAGEVGEFVVRLHHLGLAQEAAFYDFVLFEFAFRTYYIVASVERIVEANRLFLSCFFLDGGFGIASDERIHILVEVADFDISGSEFGLQIGYSFLLHSYLRAQCLDGLFHLLVVVVRFAQASFEVFEASTAALDVEFDEFYVVDNLLLAAWRLVREV